MKPTLIIALLILAVQNSFSQNSNTSKMLLDQVSEKIKTYNNISIDFKYVLENTAENVKQETRGDVVMEGDKYRLNTLGITRLFDGKKNYTISPEDEEVTISSNTSDSEDMSITPSKMLSFYKEGYTYSMDIQQSINGRKIQYVKLLPIDSNSEIKTILLGIDAQTKHIYNLIQIGKNDTKTTLTINSFKTNIPLSKSLFSFDASKYRNYYINTLD